jgi:SSS family solute:Na+ symporter
MTLTLWDWSVIAAYFLLNLCIGLYYARRARGSTSDFFLSGRNAPWWLAGTSMVATTFAADTPLLVTGLVARNGIAGNWLWWCMVMSGVMTVFFYARMWRRSGVMTDVEFAELRYSGKPAAFLRGFRALYLGLPINCIILGWVNLAMIKILQATLGVDLRMATGILIGIFAMTAFYTTLAGLWGVLVTDLFQFVLMMVMIILLAVLSVNAVGGIDALKAKVIELDGAAATGTGSRLDFFPPLDSVWMPFIALCVYLGVNWWATWYPGAEPGGGGYIAQRIFSAKDERHGVLATLWFNVAHYALRPWPWILTALVSVVLYPDLEDKESGYILTFMDPEVFPTWLRGFIIAGFAAAYMSTIATQLNWGASYIVNDFYRRFLVRDGSERQYVVVSQVVTVLLMLVSLVFTYYLDSIEGAWKLLMATGAGTGTVLLLRWYWWRINAWSEVSAMVFAAAVSLFLQLGWPKWSGDDPTQFAKLMLATVGLTTVGWLLVTLLTQPEPMEKLIGFYRRVRPAGPGWKSVAALAGEVGPPTESLAEQFVNWLLGCTLVYASLFGIGNLVFKEWLSGGIYLAVAAVAGAIISYNLSRAVWQSAGAAATDN